MPDLPRPNSPLPGSYREVTVAAVVLGIIQGVVLNVAFVYAALKLGFSPGGSTVAAIMGYAVLTRLMKRGTSVENNINQSVASGINTAGAGVVFTLPALFMLDLKWRMAGQPGLPFSAGPMLIGGIGGAILGTVLIIPLRKQMIELDRLRFPTGIAVTTIIRAGRAGVDKAKLLALGFVISMAWKLLLISGWLDRPGLLDNEEWNFSFGVLPDYLSPVLSLSLMNIAAGLLSGRGGLPFFLGGVLAWWVVSPVAVQAGWVPGTVAGSAQTEFLYHAMLRPLGIGMLAGGALMGVVVCIPAFAAAVRSLGRARRTAGEDGGDEMPLRWILTVVALGTALFFAASLTSPGIGLAEAATGTILGTAWLALAGLIVTEATGMTDQSPMSGMALISVTLMMFLYQGNVAAAMVVGVAVCVAIGQGADMMQDLKTGFLLGSKPVRQQLVQFACTWLGVPIAIGALYLLWTNGPGGEGGFGNRVLPAPQAGALMGIIDAVKSGNVPVDKYVLGGTLGALLGAAPVGGLGVLMGLAMYLPFSITLGYGIGCLTEMGLRKKWGAAFCENKLVPLAAGLIVGEALTGVGQAGVEILRSTLGA